MRVLNVVWYVCMVLCPHHSCALRTQRWPWLRIALIWIWKGLTSNVDGFPRSFFVKHRDWAAQNWRRPVYSRKMTGLNKLYDFGSLTEFQTSPKCLEDKPFHFFFSAPFPRVHERKKPTQVVRLRIRRCGSSWRKELKMMLGPEKIQNSRWMLNQK